MAATWARAEVILDANGDLLSSQVRREATRAGNQGGDDASRSFAQSFSRTLGPRLRGFFNGIRSNLADLGRQGDDTNGRLSRLSDTVRRLGFRFGNTTPMIRFRLGMMELGDASKNALKNIPNMLDQIGAAHRRAANDGEYHVSMWRRLSANTRQWTLIIGAVIASLSELAGLGSAAGSGLFVLAGALSAIVAGLGTAIIGWSVFSKDIDQLPESIRPARAAMSRLGDSFKELGDAIAVAQFEGTEGAFDSLRETVKSLTPAFQSVAKVANKLFRDLAKNLEPGTELFQNLYGFIEKSGPVFDQVTRAVGRLGAGLLVAFNNPSFQRALGQFLDYIDLLIDRFDTFLRGPGFDEWLRHGESVFGAFGGLLDTVGRLLNDMVTDATIARLVEFIDNIDNFLQGGGKGILEFAQSLDIFGIIAQALSEFGDALEPLAKPMAELASAIRAVFDAGITTLSPVISDIATALAPFVTAFADFLADNPQAVADGLLAIAGAFLVMKGAQGILGLSGLVGGFIGKMDTIVSKKSVWLGAIAGITAGIVTALPGAADGAISGNDVVSGFTNAMILGFAVGGPVGAAIAFVASLFTSMIQDMFFDDTIGVWEIGWNQILEFNSTKIGAVFNGIGVYITAGFVSTLAGIVVAFQDWKTAFDTGWNNIVNFFTVAVPSFFAGWNGGIQAGFISLVASVVVGFQTVVDRFKLGWQQIVNFFTVELPRFFKQTAADISSGVGAFGNAFAAAFPGVVSTVKYWVGVLEDVLSTITSLINSVTGAAAQAAGSGGGGGGRGVQRMASGGILYGPRRILAGEAGKEAIVPLNRALSQVDPSVRWLSAIAQGKGTPAMASGGIVGGGKQITVADGAIVVQEAGDGRASANFVIQRLAEYVNG